MKRCPGCRESKPREDFYVDVSHCDGLSSRCKACTLVKRERYRQQNRERLKVQAQADRRSEPERGCWHVMIARCHNPQTKSYARYGARGISVCQRWQDSFEDFLADMGPRPSLEHSLDRYPNQHGNYEPGNVRWATPTEQARNKTDNRMLTAYGRTQCIADWADEVGLGSRLLTDRLNLGWPVERALSEGVHPQRRHLTAFGRTRRIVDWASEIGVHPVTIANRTDGGWSAERAVSEAPKKGRPLSGKRKSHQRKGRAA